jgi:hypothetical protein
MNTCASGYKKDSECRGRAGAKSDTDGARCANHRSGLRCGLNTFAFRADAFSLAPFHPTQPMLTKESAATAADELISQQSALKREAADARARVSFLYMSSALRSIRPAERVETIQLAQQTVRRRKSVIAVSIAWAIIFILTLYVALPLPASVAALTWLGGVGPIFALQTFLVRREIRRMIAASHSIA